MAYNYEYPYVDPYRYNDDWLLKTTKDTQLRMDALEEKEAEFEERLTDAFNQHKTEITTIFNDYVNSTNQQIETWKNQTIADLNQWKITTSNQFATQYNAFVQQVNNTMSQFQNEITKEFQELSGEFAQLSADMVTFRNNITNEMTTFQNNVNTTILGIRNDITEFERDINSKIDTQNAQIRAMQEIVNNFNAQIPTLVQNYLDTLTPSLNIMNLRSMYPYLAEYVGIQITLKVYWPDDGTLRNKVTQIVQDLGSTVVTQSNVQWGLVYLSDNTQLPTCTKNIMTEKNDEIIILYDIPSMTSIRNLTFMAFMRAVFGHRAVLFSSSDYIITNSYNLAHLAPFRYNHPFSASDSYHFNVIDNILLIRWIKNTTPTWEEISAPLNDFNGGVALLDYFFRIDDDVEGISHSESDYRITHYNAAEGSRHQGLFVWEWVF